MSADYALTDHTSTIFPEALTHRDDCTGSLLNYTIDPLQTSSPGKGSLLILRLL
jgi:hypothetical protein